MHPAKKGRGVCILRRRTSYKMNIQRRIANLESSLSIPLLGISLYQ
jgi:hypothetical protein